ncbi:MAG TPA: helix-turn-helix domain-containing protein [Micromonosporaceae bacterium]
MTGQLAEEVGRLVRLERERLGLTQRALADRIGTSQQCVSRFEAGHGRATLATAERLLAALGQQARVDTEPLGADLDAVIDQVGPVTDEGRAELAAFYGYTLNRLSVVPHVIDGELAAYLQGVPVRVTRLDLVVAKADLDRLADWALSYPGLTRWVERWRDFGGPDVDPRSSGPLRWRSGHGEIRVSLATEPLVAVPIAVGGRTLRVRPLAEIERSDPQVARLLRRLRARRG